MEQLLNGLQYHIDGKSGRTKEIISNINYRNKIAHILGKSKEKNNKQHTLEIDDEVY